MIAVRIQWSHVFVIAFIVSGVSTCLAQLPPEIGYLLPPGGKAGTTVDVVIGGYDWTQDTQIFVHDANIKLEIIGLPSAVLIAEPPYWFGYKARGYAWPLPREFAARLTFPADASVGLIRWQVANANGASAVGLFHVGTAPEIAEVPQRKGAQLLPALPVTVSGQIRRIEEMDRYRFHVSKSGPVTIELLARRLGSPLHGMLRVCDPAGQCVLDIADTEGRDFTATMRAIADVEYELSLHDLDYAGDRSYVYRLIMTAAPHVQATYPAAGRRGETRLIEFVGPGLATGSEKLESITREVVFPLSAGVSSFEYAVETEWGIAKPIRLIVSDIPESVETPTGKNVSVPGAVTGTIETRFGSDVYTVQLMKGQTWEIATQARLLQSPLDLELTILGSDGKPLATNDDIPGSTDAALTFNVPADADYRIVVTDRAGKSGHRGSNYRLSIQAPSQEVEFSLPTQLGIPLGSRAKLVLKCLRKGGFQGEIPVKLIGLPEGVTAPENLVFAEKASELPIELVSAPDAAVTASLCSVVVKPQIDGQSDSRVAGTVLLATTMKPRFKLTPEGLDDVRKVHRGSTYLFPMLIERLEGYEGPIMLEMTAKQQRHRQGLSSDDFTVSADAKRVEYPIFVPEWLETTKTSRMILNGAAKVADPKGNIRTVLQRQELRFGLLPEGSLMKLAHRAGEIVVSPGDKIEVPLTLSVAAELKAPIQITLLADERTPFTASPEVLPVGSKEATLVVSVADNTSVGEHELRFRASTMKEGWPVISETFVNVEVRLKSR